MKAPNLKKTGWIAFKALSVLGALACLWFLLSGRSEVMMLALGALSCLLAAALSLAMERAKENAGTRALSASGWFHLPFYLLWLIKEIFRANFRVARLVLSRRLKIEPQSVILAPAQKSDLARAIFANSITLTPGTITVETFDDVFLVHALDDVFADATSLAAMDRRVGLLESRYAKLAHTQQESIIP